MTCNSLWCGHFVSVNAAKPRLLGQNSLTHTIAYRLLANLPWFVYCLWLALCSFLLSRLLNSFELGHNLSPPVQMLYLDEVNSQQTEFSHWHNLTYPVYSEASEEACVLSSSFFSSDVDFGSCYRNHQSVKQNQTSVRKMRSFILFIQSGGEARTLREVNLTAVLAKNPMERRQESLSFRCWRQTPRQLFQGKPTQSGRD